MTWDAKLEAVVCHSCNRVWAPVIMDINDVVQVTLIRAATLADGCNTTMGRILHINRHAARRKMQRYGLNAADDLAVPYAPPGPTARELAP